MRILAIGLGGAGCRIVNSLYSIDRRSSNVACVKAFAIDVDETILAQLKGLPEDAKIYFPALDPGPEDATGESTQTATIDIGEIVSRVQNADIGETDAIFICCGLGGSMVDVAPHIIAALRNSVVEPIFGLITLPCLAEGERKSGKAADDIDVLSPLLDGIILFDNETWYKKIRARRTTLANLAIKERSFAERMGFKKEQPAVSPALATYLLLNDAVVRRISLILRAGEFKADGGLDLAEVVLDSGEVLNTMKGMGFITIGYAVEHLPHDPLGFLSWLRPAGFFADDHKKKASRIVELAKQAIYHEISTPCDMTSAHKALILVAGPSAELSLKGYMTVRKWIDRSIAGLETRSGDYPVMNTKNVAIIVMLSGLENIPRIDEIREIRAQGRSNRQKDPDRETPPISPASITLSKSAGTTAGKDTVSPKQNDRIFRDDMIVIQVKAPQGRDSGARSSGSRPLATASHHAGIFGASQNEMPGKDSPPLTDTVPTTAGMHERAAQHPDTRSHVPQRRVIISTERETQPGHTHPAHPPAAREGLQHDHPAQGSRLPEPSGDTEVGIKDNQIRTKDTERQKIEKNLQKQRMIALSGRSPKANPDTLKNQVSLPGRTIIHHESSKVSPQKQVHEPEKPTHPDEKFPEQKTVIIAKRKPVPIRDTPYDPEDKTARETVDREGLSISPGPDMYAREAGLNGTKVGVKGQGYQAKDGIFEGKGIVRTEVPSARDTALIHTRLTPKKSARDSVDGEPREPEEDQATEQPQTSQKREKPALKKR